MKHQHTCSTCGNSWSCDGTHCERGNMCSACYAVAPVTPVVFRKWKDIGTVIALFPTLNSYASDPSLCDSFEHVGQHGAAHYDGCLRKTTPATPEEYAALKAELEAYPYNYKFRVYRRSVSNRWGLSRGR